MPDCRATETVLPDRGFNALADATRRDIIARLSEGEASVTDLAAGYDMALPSLPQQMRVLWAAGLISTTKTPGRWLAGLNVRRSGFRCPDTDDLFASADPSLGFDGPADKDFAAQLDDRAFDQRGVAEQEALDSVARSFRLVSVREGAPGRRAAVDQLVTGGGEPAGQEGFQVGFGADVDELGRLAARLDFAERFLAGVAILQAEKLKGHGARFLLWRGVQM
jgi:DNA-binding transcriptional ArsR family regulator